jgi:hypothetical protein
MIDIKTNFRNTLINASAITALVPATRITLWNQNILNTLPAITFNESDNYNLDDDMADDLPYADHYTMQLDIWVAPGNTTFQIASAVNTALEAAGWSRETSSDLIEQDTKIQRKVMRYTTRVLR